MSEERIIFPGGEIYRAVCADDVVDGVLFTTENLREADGQFFLSNTECRRLGEWLIERANQAGER